MAGESERPRDWLTQAQERTLASTLQYLEDRILALLVAIEGGPYARSLTQINADLTPAQAEACQAHLESMLQQLHSLSRALDVEPDIVSLSRRLMGGVSSMWTYLEDSRTAQLRKYGRVHPSLHDVLEPPVERMLHHLEALRAQLQPPDDHNR